MGKALANPLHKPGRRLQHNAIWKTEHPIPSVLQLPVALLISGCLRLVSRSDTIEFDDEPQRQATEIHNRSAQGDLAAKLIVNELTIAEKSPSELLGQRIRMTELTRTRGQRGDVALSWPVVS